LAVNTAEVATPDVLVVAVFTPPANVPLGPLLGGVKVTITAFNGLPPESFTVATSRAGKAVLTAVLCGVPLDAVIDGTALAVLDSENLAGVATPATEAVTV
jgi:hypothetical protein